MSKSDRKIVSRKVRTTWRQEAAAVLALLETIGDGDLPAAEVTRVQLAVLKLSGGDKSALPELADQARKDYRDLLVRAESPEYSRLGPAMSKKLDAARMQAYETALDRDRQQYAAWLEKAGV